MNVSQPYLCLPTVRLHAGQRTVLPAPFKCVICDKMKETCAHIFIPHKRSFILVLWREEGLVGKTHSTWNFGSNWPCLSENAHFQSIFAHSTSAVTPSKKSSINTHRKSTACFPMSPRWNCMLPLNPQKGRGCSKKQNGRFLRKLHST